MSCSVAAWRSARCSTAPATCTLAWMSPICLGGAGSAGRIPTAAATARSPRSKIRTAMAGCSRRSPRDCPDAWTPTTRHSPRRLNSRARSGVRRPRMASTRSGPAGTMRTGRTGTPTTSSGSRPASRCRLRQRLRTGDWHATARRLAGSRQNRPSPGSANQANQRRRFTMRRRSASEVIDQDRRQLLSTAAMGIAAAGVASLFPAYPAPAATSEEIRPFRINVAEEALVDLRRRINATRWPDRETVPDESQGVQLAAMQEIARYWGTDYDWRKVEARLNALPQFVTTIDGLDIHFLHVRSKHESALPLIVTHGWPGSIIEQLKIIDPLTNPTAHGASASDAFHLVIPSIPGYGFSARPTTTDWGPDRVARAWVVLMKRLGYSRFVAQGGDLGAIISNAMAREAPPELLGIHTNFPGTIPADIGKALQSGDPPPPGLSA